MKRERSPTNNNRETLKAVKKPKLVIQPRATTVEQTTNILRRDLWSEVIKFLDFNTYFTIIPLVNTFFYQLSKDSVITLDHLEIEIELRKARVKKHDCKKENKYLKPYVTLLQKSRNLEKLRLYIRNSDYRPSIRCANQYNSILSGIFPKMPWTQNLKVLDFSMKNYNNVLFKEVLNYLSSLEVLKLTFSAPFPTALSYIFCRFVDPEGLKLKAQASNIIFWNRYNEKICHPNSVPFTPLKELTLNYYFSYSASIAENNIFEALDKNLSLTKFTLIFPSTVNIDNSLQPKFSYNQTLRKLRLSNAFQFSYESAKDFSFYLLGNKSLKSLAISKSILKAKDEFFTAIRNNKVLKKIGLEPYEETTDSSLDINTFVELMDAVGDSSLTSFKASTSAFIRRNLNFVFHFSVETVPDHVLYKHSKYFIEGVQRMLTNNLGLRKVWLSVDAMPRERLDEFADVILRILSSEQSSLEYFNGFPLKGLMNDTVNTLHINRRYRFLQSTNKELIYDGDSMILTIMLCKIIPFCRNLRYIDTGAKLLRKDNIFNQINPGVIDIEQIKQTANEAYEFGFEIYYKDVPAIIGLILLLTLKGNNMIRNLNLSHTDCSCLYLVIGEILSDMPNLATVVIEGMTHMIHPISHKLMIDILSNSPSLHELVINGITFNLQENDQIFTSLIKHPSLMKLEISRLNVSSTVSAFSNEASIGDLLKKTNLQILNLSSSSFTPLSIELLANGLKSNMTLKELILADINLAIPNEGLASQTNGGDFNFWRNKIDCLLALSDALKNNPYIEIVDIRFNDIPSSQLSVPNEITQLFIDNLKKFLETNSRLRVLNFIFPIPPNFLMKYSELLLNYLQSSPNLEILNNYNIKSMVSNEFSVLTIKHYHSNRDDFDSFMAPKLSRVREAIYCHYAHFGTIATIMPIVLSQIYKENSNKIAKVKFLSKEIQTNVLLNKKKGESSLDLGFLLKETQPPDVTFILNCLSAHKFTQHLDFTGCVLCDIDFEVLGKNLPCMESLKSISIRDIKPARNPYLSHILSNTSLTSLEISKVNFENFDIRDFPMNLSSHPSLEILKLTNCDLLTKTAMIKKCEDSSFKAVLSGFKKSKISHLDLSGNEIGDEELKKILKAVKTHPFISKLVIQQHEIREKDGIVELASMLCDPAHTLKELSLSSYTWSVSDIQNAKGKLDLSYKLLSATDLIILSTMLICLQLKKVHGLDLSHNPSLFSEPHGVSALLDLIKYSPINSINLQECCLNEQEDRILHEIFIAACNSLEALSLGSPFTEQQLSSILSALKSNPKRLKKVNFSPCRDSKFKALLTEYIEKSDSNWTLKGYNLWLK